ncbi:MAG: cardiolipin synthase, partial [Clostridiales bacterium]|nr:cardiolipin synthase [Clostridiales bacterium]
ICTPYLIIDSEMINALANAAKCGLDVRIITPHVPDKGYVHATTRSYYAQLIRAGVRIFEYSPGFVHSKTFVCDDLYGICGTINLDYRSLYLHHECAVWMYDTKALRQMRDSYLETLAYCQEIDEAWCKKQPGIQKFIQQLLRLFAPLM